MRQPTVVGNWKMNASLASTTELLNGLAAGWAGAHKAEVAVCPPYTYLAKAVELLADSAIAVGAQDVSEQEKGAYTGQISADMLLDLGCKYAIVGHSERREYQGESSALVAQKFQAAMQKGLVPILCVGETLEEREQDKTFAVIAEQDRKSVV
mgnify:CR=1 FL=1